MWRKVGETYLKIILYAGAVVVFVASLLLSYDKYDGFSFFQFIIDCGIGALILLFAVFGLGMFVEIAKHLESIDQNIVRLNQLLERQHHNSEETKM